MGDFNLSEKELIFNDEDGFVDASGMYDEKEVKEFIRLLKEKFNECEMDGVVAYIDKLAGEKLNKEETRAMKK
jgi:hypothetical protein